MQLVRRLFLVAAFASLALWLGSAHIACANRSGSEPRRELLESWGNYVILPGYRDVETAARALDERAKAFCAAPSADALASVQDAWWKARAPWKRSEVFAFGPYRELPWRLGPRIDSWPARAESIDEVLAASDPIRGDGLGTFQKGLPAIEYLIYEPSAGVLGAYQATPRRCEYLTAITSDLVEGARAMVHAWDPAGEDYLGELTRAGSGSQAFSSLQLALGEVVNRMAFTLENIRAEKLNRPLGRKADGTPQPDTAESRFSGRSLEDIRDNLRGIELVYFGTGEPGSQGLNVLLRDRSIDFDADFRAKMDASRAALDAITKPLTLAVVDEPGAVSTANERLRDLQRLVQVDILNTLSLTPSFNDNDGD